MITSEFNEDFFCKSSSFYLNLLPQLDVSYFNLDRIVKWSLYSIFLIIYFICIVWMKEKCLKSSSLFIPLMAVRPPPQNSAKAKKLGGDQLPIKSIVRLIISGG